MKKTLKVTAFVMALMLVIAAFASCGGGGDSASVSGKTETWGNITVLVPDGMKLTGGNILDKKNPDVVNIAKEDKATNYFLITISDDENSAKSGIDSTRSMNKGCEDITLEFDNGKWEGVAYDYSGMEVFQIYGKVGGRIAVVQSYGFGSDSETTKAILNSLEVKKS